MKRASNLFAERPGTALGWWAIGLAMANVVFMFSWSILPGGAALGFLCGLAGGITGLIAIIRQHERSWLVFLSVLPLLGVLMFFVGEFLFPH